RRRRRRLSDRFKTVSAFLPVRPSDRECPLSSQWQARRTSCGATAGVSESTQGALSMRGLFLSTRPLTSRKRATIGMLLERRGTLPTKWVTNDGRELGHSLLPMRGATACEQPLQGRKGILLFTGELWEVAPGAN